MPTYKVTFDYDTTVIDAGRAARGLPPFEQVIQEVAVKLAQQAAMEYPDPQLQIALQQLESGRAALLNEIAGKVSVVREPEES